MPSETYQALYRLIETLPVVSTHEHHAPDDFQRQLTLERDLREVLRRLARGSSPARTSLPGQLPGAIPPQQLLRVAGKGPAKGLRLRSEDHGGQLGRSLRADQPDGTRTPARTSPSCAGRPLSPRRAGHLLGVRQRHRHPEIFAPTMRTDMFVRCFHPAVHDHDDNNPFEHYPDAPRSSFADYLDFLEALFTRWREAGAVTLKSASAYERSLAYGGGRTVRPRPRSSAVRRRLSARRRAQRTRSICSTGSVRWPPGSRCRSRSTPAWVS